MTKKHNLTIKKNLIILIFIALILVLFNVNTVYAEEDYIKQSKLIENVMDTTVILTIYNKDSAKTNEQFEYIENLFRKYHYLTDSFNDLSSENVYNLKTNLSLINQAFNVNHEVDKELYDLLLYAESLRIETDGYFDYTIGNLIDIWKEGVTKYKYQEMPKNEFQLILNQANNYQVVTDPIEFIEENGLYYVKIKEGVKLDLGGIAKGYVTNLAKDYLLANNTNYYMINSGQSSIAVGEKPDQTNYSIAIQDPVNSNRLYYAVVYVTNQTITTSGNNLQYFLYEGIRYHHIINPKTKMPAANYHALTIVGKDAGAMDAYSTALFSMPKGMLDEGLAQAEAEGAFYETHTNNIINKTEKINIVLENNIEGANKIGRYLILGLSIFVIAVLIIGTILLYKNKQSSFKRPELFKDLALFIILILAFGVGYLNYHFWPKANPSIAEINYKLETYVTVDFDMQSININKQQSQDYPRYEIIDLKHFVTILGDYKINNERQEVVVEINFVTNEIRVSEENSPHNFCSLQGWTGRGAIICMPNNVTITFRSGNNFDLIL